MIKEIEDQLEKKIREFAHHRRDAVMKRLESRHLAGLLVQKFGEGLIQSIPVFVTNEDDAALLKKRMQTIADHAVESIDHNWRAHANYRYLIIDADVLGHPKSQMSPIIIE